MRVILGIGLSLALASVVAAEDKKDEKIDAKKLVGKWEQVEPKDGGKTTVEYTADGKIAGVLVIGDKSIKVTGTYKLDGNKLAQTVRFEDEKDERKTTLVITKLTDDVLEGSLEDKKFAFKRLKKK